MSGPEGSFTIRSEHFVERHQLLVIIALGETIIAIGVSAQGDLTRPLVLVGFLLAMVLISALWWVYFGTGDGERGLRALIAAPESRRPRLCIRAYGHAHLLHIAGLVLVAAALHEVVHDPAHHLSWGFALTSAGGVAAFLLGQASFRHILRTGPVGVLLAAAALALALTPVGALVSGLGQLVGLAVVAAGAAAALAGRDPAALPDAADVET